ncbi:MAG: hypothetical protein RLZZ383_2084 [Pseudomonadota bacterium]
MARFPLCSQALLSRAAASKLVGAWGAASLLVACGPQTGDGPDPEGQPQPPATSAPDGLPSGGSDAPDDAPSPPADAPSTVDSDTGGDAAPVCEGCDDGDACNGVESCGADGACTVGVPVACGADATCVTTQGVATCIPWCGLPTGPNVVYVAGGDLLTFVADRTVETAVIDVSASATTATWTSTPTVTPPAPAGTWRVLARAVDTTCANGDVLDLPYTWATRFPGPAGSPTGRAWAHDDPALVGWAAAVVDQTVGADVSAVWLDPSRALGPANTATTDITALGEGGTLTVTFADPIADGAGDDFAVFENGFADDFLELAEVEVSSDGVTFARFDTASQVEDAIGAYGTLDPRALHGFAGTVRVGFGVGFDLERLTFSPAVVAGLVDLLAITHVRLIDVPGDGRRTDAWGRPVYDPWPTVGSAGFDLDAVGVIHRATP